MVIGGVQVGNVGDGTLVYVESNVLSEKDNDADTYSIVYSRLGCPRCRSVVSVKMKKIVKRPLSNTNPTTT